MVRIASPNGDYPCIDLARRALELLVWLGTIAGVSQLVHDIDDLTANRN